MSLSKQLPLLWIALLMFPAPFSASTWAAQGKWPIHDDILSITFPMEGHGWASGRWGTILHTEDGARTWEHQQTGVDNTLASIHFTDRENGWAVGSKGTIIHTGDGGKTWERQQSPVDYFHMAVRFVTPKIGWIVSERTHILMTRDGGKTWRVQFADEDFILKGIAFADPLNGWAVGELGHIFHTADGGTTWETQGGRYELNSDGDLVGDPSLYDVIALDALNAWAVGMDGHVIRTIDGGRNWIKVDAGAPKVNLYNIETDYEGTMIIAGKGLCMYSNDSGQNWETAQFNPPINYGWIYGLAHSRSAGFVTGGEQGAIYLSNSIKSWNRVK
jgi:photosystem II stability/assembly factor-like uncharacterized protein